MSSSRSARAVVALLLIVLLAGCQARVAVDARVEKDGSGELTVGIGLDDDAMRRIGDLNEQVRLGDLGAAGWKVTPAAKQPDGYTWLRATKSFPDIDGLNLALAELTGTPPLFRDFRLTSEDNGTTINHRLTGVIDTTKGLTPFSDEQLTARLGGDPFGGRITAVEREEGRPVAEMVTFEVTASVDHSDGDGGVTGIWRPTLADTQTTPIELSLSDAKPATSLGGGVPLVALAVVLLAVVLMLGRARSRFTRTPA